MSFISWQYLLLLVASAVAYWFMPVRGRQMLLLVASTTFYAFWDVRFVALLLTSTAVDYLLSNHIEGTRLSLKKWLGVSALPLLWLEVSALVFKQEIVTSAWIASACFALLMPFYPYLAQRFSLSSRVHLGCSLVLNLSVLFFFKYFGFFQESMVALLKTVGLQPHELTLHILLPVGISFYTFQSLAYTWDVYRRQMQACPSFITYASYLSFFPQLVAGPIERAKHLLPQIATPRTWSVDHLHVGCRQILVGFFQKVFVADHCALIANYVFDSTTPLNGAWATLGAVAFAFQIYGDFAGYTNIARGSARLMGVELSKNFLFPYFAHAPSDFWQRWHISLSSWFRDYVYIPLGGNRGTHGRTLLNLLVTMFLAGLWHGASWMFVLWGVYHGVLLVVYRTALPLRWLEEQAPRFLAIACMSLLTLFGWVIFRSTTPEIFLHWCSAWTQPSALALSWSKPAAWVALHILPLLLLQIITWKQRDETNLQHLAWGWRTVIYLLLVVAITSATSSEQEFIYFQF